MPSLRERQKENRRRQILHAAREQFLEQGFDATTMETIAVQAQVSSVTVYNYYGTKSGLLLALVDESDALLRERLAAIIVDPPSTLADAFCTFAATIREHALSFLSKPVWRQVIAASIIEGGSQFGRGYAQMDLELARVMTKILQRLRDHGHIGAAVDLDILGQSLFHLQNARFLQFISIDDLKSATVDRYLREDIIALLSISQR